MNAHITNAKDDAARFVLKVIADGISKHPLAVAALKANVIEIRWEPRLIGGMTMTLVVDSRMAAATLERQRAELQEVVRKGYEAIGDEVDELKIEVRK